MERLGIDAHSLSAQRTGVANVVMGYITGIETISDASVRLYASGVINVPTRFPLTIVRGRPFWTTFWLGNYFLTHRTPPVMLYGAHSIPWYSPARNIVVIHDLAFELFPDHFTTRDRRRLQLQTRQAVRKADHLIAVSEATKQDLVRLYGVPAHKITVIYLGCDHQLFRPSSSAAIDRVRQQYALSRPYIISVGTLQRRKNHAGLVRAWGQVNQSGVAVDLVLVGGKGWLDEDLATAIAESPFQDRIHRLGFVPNEDLPALYSGATAFALPSFYEGFGLPVLEAMACGTPTITANNSSLVELFGAASAIIDPLDLAGLATALTKLVTDRDYQALLSKKGLARAKEFTWTKTGERVWRLAKELADEKR